MMPIQENKSAVISGQSISVTGTHWCRGWQAYRADDSPEGTVPGRIVLVTHWVAREALDG